MRDFDSKWLRGGAPDDEPFVGSADIQSLADMGNSFDVVKGMRFVPFTGQTVLQLGDHHPGACGAAAADDDLAGGIARTAAEGRLLMIVETWRIARALTTVSLSALVVLFLPQAILAQAAPPPGPPAPQAAAEPAKPEPNWKISGLFFGDYYWVAA